MRICLINNLYPPFSRGGAERIVELSARGLKSAGHEVFIITTKPIFRKIDKASNKIKVYYINSFFYYLDKIPMILRLFWHISDMFNAGKYIKIKSILKKEKPDMVLTHNLKGLGGYTSAAINKLGIKHIHTLHDIQLLHPSGLLVHGQENKLNTVLSKIYFKINRFYFRNVKIVISPSKWLIKEHLKYNFFVNSRKLILPNPVLVKKFSDHKNFKANFPVIKLLYIGHINNAKGALFLIDALKKLTLKYRLGLAGQIYSPTVKKKIALNKNIDFLGYLNRDEIEKIIRESDLLIVPSLCYENSPTVIYEAASMGLPVLASRIGGITETVHFLGGILFNPGNSQDLVFKLNWAIKNPRVLHKIGESAQLKAKEYSLDFYIEKLLAAIKKN